MIFWWLIKTCVFFLKQDFGWIGLDDTNVSNILFPVPEVQCLSIQQSLIWSNNPTIFHQDAWWNARSMNYGMARLRRRWAEMRDLEVKIQSFKTFSRGKTIQYAVMHSIYQSVFHLSIYQSIHLSDYPFIYLSIFVPFYHLLSTCKFVNLSIHASTYPPTIYLSKIYVSNYTQYQEKTKLCRC